LRKRFIGKCEGKENFAEYKKFVAMQSNMKFIFVQANYYVSIAQVSNGISEE
jgi:hypothetical protein